MDNSINKGRVSFDPGWNDPPKMSFNSQQTPPNRPRNFLNKRVSFPLSGNNISPASVPSVNLPPMPSGAPTAMVPPNATQKITSSNCDMSINSESVLMEVKALLLGLLESSSELGAKANDIRRRLDVMEQMWQDGKLNIEVQTQMKELAHALRDDEPRKADDIHKALMVNEVSKVGTWMPGVKQLIYHSIARSELLSIGKE
ncbi:steroid receptor RNA activator 1 [Leguminivora glycinivorella]|uniref:steroid receptor RNA activator 1 n=1 Tax=Leguminivora glycinivorella TaxID=1035111 RepID=UPI00200FC0C6|nr:steroid receptor RNA activator 1 [Leguminivora glycinivorella]